MPDLVTQPTARPTRKVQFGAVVGVLSYLLMAGAARVFGAEVPEEIAGAIPVLAATLAAYVARERASDAGT